jgi:structural maintenance of chromosome 1
MDAISFVLGIKSSHLRSAHLRDLIYRGRVLRTSTAGGLKNGDAQQNGNGTNGEAADGEEDDDEEEGTQGGSDPKTAWVMAVYADDDGKEHQWKRSITAQGASEYRVNGRQCTAAQYNAALEAQNILIKARNFLVFQVCVLHSLRKKRHVDFGGDIGRC